uniref:Uncharacterized protein n=1 Tax=Arion vulgaris TaxID=1028688 RepID=A0A0B7AZV3_9EUPU
MARDTVNKESMLSHKNHREETILSALTMPEFIVGKRKKKKILEHGVRSD